LEQVTFPEEKKYGNVKYAKEVYGEVVGRTLNDGVSISVIGGKRRY